MNDTGQWTCHMSSNKNVGMDFVQKLNVRVAYTALAAEKVLIEAPLGSKVTIRCKVTYKSKALEYCRFALPDGSGFSVDKIFTENK